MAAAYPPPPPDEATSRAHLAELTVAPPLSMSGYSRDEFPHWIDQGNNCNAREVVLQRAGSNVQVGSDCYPTSGTSGTRYSVYDQVTVTEPPEATIDHIVPLADAWRSGAKAPRCTSYCSRCSNPAATR